MTTPRLSPVSPKTGSTMQHGRCAEDSVDGRAQLRGARADRGSDRGRERPGRREIEAEEVEPGRQRRDARDGVVLGPVAGRHPLAVGRFDEDRPGLALVRRPVGAGHAGRPEHRGQVGVPDDRSGRTAKRQRADADHRRARDLPFHRQLGGDATGEHGEPEMDLGQRPRGVDADALGGVGTVACADLARLRAGDAHHDARGHDPGRADRDGGPGQTEHASPSALRLCDLTQFSPSASPQKGPMAYLSSHAASPRHRNHARARRQPRPPGGEGHPRAAPGGGRVRDLPAARHTDPRAGHGARDDRRRGLLRRCRRRPVVVRPRAATS